MSDDNQMKEITSYLAGAENAGIEIVDLTGKTYQVSLRLPIAVDIKAKPLLIDFAKRLASDGGFIFPPRNPADTDDQYALKVGQANSGKMVDLLVSMLDQRAVDVAAVLLKLKPEEVADGFSSEEVVKLLVPFLLSLLSKLKRSLEKRSPMSK